jgi:hypothetical protein
MIIDIISYTEEQYAALTAAQLLEIREAQTKKNRLERIMRDKVQQEKNDMIRNGIFNSQLFDYVQQKLEEDCEKDVNLIREGLLFYLRYSMRPEGTVDGSDAPYIVNFALSEQERLLIVKNYYETTYTDKKELFSEFLKDKIAPLYVGEYYASLYEHFMAGAGAI